MKFLGYDNVLCLSPHPDDIEYSMMGTIMKYSDTSFTVLCLTGGGTKFLKAKCLNSGYTIDRQAEVRNSWKENNIDNVKILFSDCEYLEEKDRDPGWINYLENEYTKRYDYDCILMPTRDDSMFEHRFVNGLAPALTRHHPISIVEYRTPSTLNSWSANMFVDISALYDKKTKALKCFESQQEKSYFSKLALEMFHTNFQCGKKGMIKTEQFKIIELFVKE